MSGIIDENKATPTNITVKFGAWEPRNFPTDFQRVRKDLDTKCLWTSEDRRYWKIGGNSTGIQNSEGKLFSA